MSEPTVIADILDLELRVDLSSGIQMVKDGEDTRLQSVNTAFIREIVRNPAGRELKPRPLWGPIGIPDKPLATKAELLRAIADVFDAEAKADPSITPTEESDA